MCAVSMIMDHYHDKWKRPKPYTYPNVPAWPSQPIITPEEIAEFKRLLERAREYDKQNNEPDCEMEEKKDRIKKLADELGVKIDFI